jgi:hypothetical protein
MGLLLAGSLSIADAARPRHDGSEVLRPGPRSVGPPGNDRRITEIAHVEAGADERLDQSSVAEGGRRALLAHSAGAGPGRSADRRCRSGLRDIHV